MSPVESNNASAYKHALETVQRPDVGVEAQFPHKKAVKTYRYDSSLAPELSWDESSDRAFAEWLLTLWAGEVRHVSLLVAIGVIAGTQWSTRNYMNMAPLLAAQTEAYGATIA